MQKLFGLGLLFVGLYFYSCSKGLNSDSSQQAPAINNLATYEVTKTTHVYAQGFRHNTWRGTALEELDLILDLYVPENAPANRPLMVMVHGGGFTGGSREQEALVEFSNYFASRGWVTASIDYRLASSRGTIPQSWYDTVVANLPVESQEQSLAMYPASRDAKAALRWLLSKKNDYGINADYITVVGGSAGAMLSVMLGISSESDFVSELSVDQDSTLASTNLDQSFRVKTIVEHWGSKSVLDVAFLHDGKDRFENSLPPMSIVHGTGDLTVDYSNGEALRDEYLAAGATYAFYTLDGAGHGAWRAKFGEKNLLELAYDFVVEQQNLIVE